MVKGINEYEITLLSDYISTGTISMFLNIIENKTEVSNHTTYCKRVYIIYNYWLKSIIIYYWSINII